MNDSDDDYVWPGTDVLINKLNIRDSKILTQFEEEATLQRIREGLPAISISVEGYCRIHKHLFQDVYNWAGKLRTVQLAKDNSFFCRAEFIAPEMDKRFALIQNEKELAGLSAEQFAIRAAEHLSELNAIHPFREGNGRTQRAFLEVLAERTGHPIDLRRMTPEIWHQASIRGFHKGDYEPMRKLIATALTERKD